MVVGEVYVEHIPILDTKSDPPVTADRHGPKAFQLALQGMQPIAGEIQIRRYGGSIQNGQHVFNSISQRRADPACIAFPQSFQASMPEAPDHNSNCNVTSMTYQSENAQSAEASA